MSITKTATLIAASLALALAGYSFAAGPVLAQDAAEEGLPEVAKRENVRYYNVIYVKFKAGHNDAAWEILYEKLQPASEAAGNRVVVLDFDSGIWTSAIYIPMPDGYGQLEYAFSPRAKEFWDALIAQEGSLEAARAVFKEWNGHIARSATAIAHMHLPPPEDEDGEGDGDE